MPHAIERSFDVCTTWPAGRHVLGTAIVGLILGFGGMTAGTTFVQASDRSGILGFFEDLFRAPAPAPVRVAERSPKRYTSLPNARRISETRARHVSPRPMVDLARTLRTDRSQPMRAQAVSLAAAGARTVCVRTCDGYIFPLGHLRAQSDMPVHRAACAAACPNAQTALFTLPAGRTELEQSVGPNGRPYLAAAWANVYRQKRVQNCSCQPQGVAAAPLSVARDSTIRIGDVVANADGADVVTNLSNGRVQLADYRFTRALSRGARRAIDLRVGSMRRDADDVAFRRALRLAERGSVRVRFAEAGFARLRKNDASVGFSDIAVAESSASFKPVRQVTPWQDEHSAR